MFMMWSTWVRSVWLNGSSSGVDRPGVPLLALSELVLVAIVGVLINAVPASSTGMFGRQTVARAAIAAPQGAQRSGPHAKSRAGGTKALPGTDGTYLASCPRACCSAPTKRRRSRRLPVAWACNGPAFPSSGPMCSRPVPPPGTLCPLRHGQRRGDQP